jgi:predicted phosphodiesterase
MAFEGSPLDLYAADIQAYLNVNLTNQEIADRLYAEFGVETSEASVRRAIARNGLEKSPRQPAQNSERPGIEYVGDDAIVTSEVAEAMTLGDLEGVIKRKGLNPDEWIVERVSLNEWDMPSAEGGTRKMGQSKVSLKRRQALDFIMPAVEVKTRKPSKKFKFDSSFLAAVLGDEQEPYADRVAEEKVYDWLTHNQPEVIVHLGDLMDLPTISRHKDNPEWSASVQECLNAGYQRLANYRDICKNATIIFMLGNHDERLRNELLLRAERMYGIRPADKPGQPNAIEALSPRNLLHLDELGVEFIDPKGGYAHAQYNLSSQLGVRHGWLTGENTASKTLDRLGHSIIVGHTHAQRITYKTVYNIDGIATVLQGIETGTLSQIETGIGYTVAPNWQHGFAGVQVWEDGSFHADLATLAGGTLRWRDQRF